MFRRMPLAKFLHQALGHYAVRMSIFDGDGELQTLNAEQSRLNEHANSGVPWKKWGPYLADRQWGTVREDYSADGEAWNYLSHDESRSYAYRWGEDGIGGISDDRQFLCLAPAFWNGRDAILKERLFGLTGNEGNHGEDVKECYYYLDNAPTHSYMKFLYKYPQSEFPYSSLISENRERTKQDPEFELVDTGIFNDGRYFDLCVEYAKDDPEDILVRISATNRSAVGAPVHIIPQIWFRNTWAWAKNENRPVLRGSFEASAGASITVDHQQLGNYVLYADGTPELLFCENETNHSRLYGVATSGYAKDGINDFVVQGDLHAVNPGLTGTRAGLHYTMTVPAGGTVTVRLRLCRARTEQPFDSFETLFAERVREVDEFYAELQADISCEDERAVQRQAFAGMLWSKQFYAYDVRTWLAGDPGQPPPPPDRRNGRNHNWKHVRCEDIISMPDTWEYPWFAAWDLAFHCVALAVVDPHFAKRQLRLLTHDWYMHPNGQLPAYEWSFDDANPPIHAWAAWRVFQIDRKSRGNDGDFEFLERVFLKLLLNFTWWVNRKDDSDLNVFQGGFLGLDNIGVFDRNEPFPSGGHLDQADGTSWMAMYSLNLMRIALELARRNRSYEDIATKFFEHFLYIAHAMLDIGGKGVGLWNEDDEFFYDVLSLPDGTLMPLKLRSMVGLIPLFAVETIEPDLLEALPSFAARLEWFLDNHPELADLVSRWHVPGRGERRLLSLLRGHRMKALLRRMLDETEFLSDYGVRSLSRAYAEAPFRFSMNDHPVDVAYEPGESRSYLFGGNSNWRGPVWMPANYLIIESLQKFHHYYGDEFRIECPTGSGNFMTILGVADELTRRIKRLFLKGPDGTRPIHAQNEITRNDPHFRDYILFYEYFHGDSGRGVGASHQTGWTGLIAKLIQPRR